MASLHHAFKRNILSSNTETFVHYTRHLFIPLSSLSWTLSSEPSDGHVVSLLRVTVSPYLGCLQITRPVVSREVFRGPVDLVLGKEKNLSPIDMLPQLIFIICLCTATVKTTQLPTPSVPLNLLNSVWVVCRQLNSYMFYFNKDVVQCRCCSIHMPFKRDNMWNRFSSIQVTFISGRV